MSDDDDDTCLFGTALPELRDDVIPTKKPITVADQIAVDENGRRRFHGAFTGGFSAGFWNTVGSKDGWQPQTFKSSRHEKANRVVQAPNDFMDDEDVGEFGIAPQRIQTTEDFTADGSSGGRSGNRKRPAVESAEGPILGTPVLNLFLKPAKDKASVSLLKKMGWRENQGIGSRLTRKEKRNAKQRALKESKGQRVYNCDMGPMLKDVTVAVSDEDEEGDEGSTDSESEITFAPDDYEPMVHAFKTNRFGLGYTGLNKNPILQQHVNLFAPFELLDKKNKKLSITGQAFGVGAFEEDDDDIYAKEDLTTYDFSLEDKRTEKAAKAIQQQKSNVIEGFAPAKQQQVKKPQFVVNVPDNFKPRNWTMRKSRFGPVVTDLSTFPSAEPMGHRRHVLSAEERGQILNDDVPMKAPCNDKEQVAIEIIDETIPKALKKDEFIKLEESVASEIVPQKPRAALDKLSELFGDRFVSEKTLLADEPPPPPSEPKNYEVIMKRTKIIWSPCPLLCQKMNIAEPMSSKANPNANKSGAFSLFQCLGQSGGSKNRNRRRDEPREFTPAIKSDDENSKLLKMISSSRPTTSRTEPPVIKPTPGIVEPPKSTPKMIPVVNPIKIVPKTELEIKVLAAESKHPAEKKDIYKAIFDSSSDDESDEETHTTIIAPTNIPAIVIPKLSRDVNVLRNTSPPRGIFANFLSKPTALASVPEPIVNNEPDTNQATTDKADTIGADNNVYGPILPAATHRTLPNIPKHTFTRKTASTEPVTIDRLSFSSFLRKSVPEHLTKPVVQVQSTIPVAVVQPEDLDEWVDKNDVFVAVSTKTSSNSGKKKKDKHHKKSKKHKKDKIKEKSSKKSKKKDKR